MWVVIVIVVAAIFGLAAACDDGTTTPPSGESSDLTACYNLAKQMAEEGHSRDKQWLNDQLDYCDKMYG
jgi:hypothetical protein